MSYSSKVSAVPNFDRVGIATETVNYNTSQHSQGQGHCDRRHYSEADEDGTLKGNEFESSAEPNFERVGIETETENYNTTQRQHYSEADEDDTANEIADERRHYSEADEDGTANEKDHQRRHYSEAVQDGTANEIAQERRHYSEAVEDDTAANEIADLRRHYSEAEEAIRVEKKIVEDCEGVLSHRKHFPGSTTSNIFNKA